MFESDEHPLAVSFQSLAMTVILPLKTESLFSPHCQAGWMHYRCFWNSLLSNFVCFHGETLWEFSLEVKTLGILYCSFSKILNFVQSPLHMVWSATSFSSFMSLPVFLYNANVCVCVGGGGIAKMSPQNTVAILWVCCFIQNWNFRYSPKVKIRGKRNTKQC